MSMFDLLRSGAWWLRSVADPRWSASGTALVGGFVRPAAIDRALEELKARYGKEPEDLEWGYMKD